MLNVSAAIDPVFQHLWPMLDAITDRPPVVVEIGVHHGTTTRLFHMAARRPIHWYGFEPDPRNLKVLWAAGICPFSWAASDEEGTAILHGSGGETPGCPGREHTDSSSLNVPTAHLEAHPWCTFRREDCFTVHTMPVDKTVIKTEPVIDLIWADVQGAQRKVLRGAEATLRRTRYLYIEVHPTPMYEDEPTFEELCAMLPDFEVVQRYPADVLFLRKGAEP